MAGSKSRRHTVAARGEVGGGEKEVETGSMRWQRERAHTRARGCCCGPQEVLQASDVAGCNA
eukprot:216544-Chlamydomonas_euryale.AAC.1